MLGFGVPGARSSRACPTSTDLLGRSSRSCSSTRRSAEVYRAGHRVGAPEPGGRRALARPHARRRRCATSSLPQAVRRVIPPLLNDFIGLQKDTALVGVLGVVEAFRQAQIDVVGDVQLHATTSSRRRSSSRSRSRSRASPTGSSRATGGGSRREARVSATPALGSRACTSPSASSRCCAASTSTVAEHEVVCLIGASGSGKSTLLRCVNLLEPIDAGRIVVDGEEITAPRRRRQPRSGAGSGSSSRPSTSSRT